MIKIFICVVILSLCGMANAVSSEDLKTYYEQQKQEIIATFKAPLLGSQISLRLATGQIRTGILMKLNEDSVAVLVDNGTTVDYQRTALHDTTKEQLFAEDFAHALALEKTREYKQQLQLENLAEYHAGLHEARVFVNAKVDKDSDKNVEEDEHDLPNGATLTTTTTTRTYTETQHLKISIANNTTHPDTYTLAWAFFGESVASETIALHDSGSRQVTVEGRKRKDEDIASEAFVVEKETRNIVNSGSDHTGDPRISESGTENAGWLVVLKYGNEILDTKGSSSSFETEEWINQIQ